MGSSVTGDGQGTAPKVEGRKKFRVRVQAGQKIHSGTGGRRSQEREPEWE